MLIILSRYKLDESFYFLYEYVTYKDVCLSIIISSLILSSTFLIPHRSFLQNRRRAPHDRHPSSIHHWRGSSMCWIRGSLYQVSANKLSCTVASNTSINRTGKLTVTAPVDKNCGDNVPRCCGIPQLFLFLID